MGSAALRESGAPALMSPVSMPSEAMSNGSLVAISW
jgi:hypothetical protein